MFEASPNCLMKFFTISMFLLLKGCEVTPSTSLPHFNQSSFSPIPHANSSSLKKSASAYTADDGLIWLNIFGKIAPGLPTPQQDDDERGVKKSSTHPKPRSLVPRPYAKGPKHKLNVFTKTISNGNIFQGYHRLRGKMPSRRGLAFIRHKSETKALHPSDRRHSKKIENERGINFKKSLRDSHEKRVADLADVFIDVRSNPIKRRSLKEGIEDSGEHRMLEGLLSQYAPSFGTKQESLDEENTINKVKELTKLSAMAPIDTNPLDIRRNIFSDVDVSVGEMRPWEHKDYDGDTLRRSRVADDHKRVREEKLFDMQGLRQSTYPFLLHKRTAREVFPDYSERFPKVSTIHSFPEILPFNRALPMERFQELPSITEQENGDFPTSDFLPPHDEMSPEYAAGREPIAPEEGLPIDEPEPIPEPVPEPEPAPIPELPFIKEIPPIREPEAPPAPNLDPKKTFAKKKKSKG